MKVTPLYSTVMLLKIMPGDMGLYRQAREDLRGGRYCGADVASLAPDDGKRAGEMLGFMLFDDLSEGRMEGFDSWLPLVPAIDALLPSKTFDAALEAYCFRTSEAAQTDPALAKIDPNKVWTFNWTALAGVFSGNRRLIQPGDFADFTDVSAYQRHDRLVVTLMGTLPLAGGQRNKYGFYQQAMPPVDIAGLKEPKSLNYAWRQGTKDYEATLELSGRETPGEARPARFPGPSRHGLVIFDVTLAPEEAASAIAQYRAYYEQAGFHFGAEAALPDVPAYLTGGLPPRTDYIVRDGHADGDDDNPLALYSQGYVLRGEKAGGETVEFVFNTVKDPKIRRLSYQEFATLLKRRADSHRPLVYFDTSCWGLEKAWISLGNFRASQLMILSARTPVNFFRAAGDASKLALDAIRAGGDFAALRRKLRATAEYASDHGDHFILPDEKEYPRAGPLTKIRREIFVRDANGVRTPYTPDGYI